MRIVTLHLHRRAGFGHPQRVQDRPVDVVHHEQTHQYAVAVVLSTFGRAVVYVHHRGDDEVGTLHYEPCEAGWDDGSPTFGRTVATIGRIYRHCGSKGEKGGDNHAELEIAEQLLGPHRGEHDQRDSLEHFEA